MKASRSSGMYISGGRSYYYTSGGRSYYTSGGRSKLVTYFTSLIQIHGRNARVMQINGRNVRVVLGTTGETLYLVNVRHTIHIYRRASVAILAQASWLKLILHSSSDASFGDPCTIGPHNDDLDACTIDTCSC